jgi:serine phosphatase RsbU (regulator of sigma subunit)
MGDVAGNRSSSAETAAWFAGHLRQALAANADLSQAMNHINRAFCNSFGQDLLATLVLCLLDPETGKVTVVNAGHPSPFIRRYTPKALEQVPVEVGGPPFGFMEDFSYDSFEVELSPGDMVVLWDDAIADAMNRDNCLYGGTRLKSLLSTFEGDAQEIGGAVLRDLRGFCDGRSQDFGWAIVIFGRQRT